MKYYETKLKRDINRIKDLIDGQIALREQSQLFHGLQAVTARMLTQVIDCDSNRELRLSLEKEISGIRILSHKHYRR